MKINLYDVLRHIAITDKEHKTIGNSPLLENIRGI